MARNRVSSKRRGLDVVVRTIVATRLGSASRLINLAVDARLTHARDPYNRQMRHNRQTRHNPCDRPDARRPTPDARRPTPDARLDLPDSTCPTRPARKL
jgi:hypothetical protein